MTHTTSPITIIGAGIGGLTTALALKQQGIQAAIYESSPEIKPVGAGIIMAHNAMQVFEKLGIHHTIEKAGHSISHIKITNAQGAILSSLDLSEYEQKYGVHNIAIHRGELQKILAEEIGYDRIHLNKRLSQIEKKEIYDLTFEDGSTLKSSFVIGADGIKSVVREQLFPKSTIRSANQKCWRGICEIQLPQKYHHQAIEAWGKGKRFGFSKISDTKVYWFAVVNSKKDQTEETDLASLFGEFHSDMLDLILATPKEQIIVNDIIDLKPISKWQDGNSCLLGDAAHATTPNLGQGACQAVEDAYVLGKLLAQGMPFEQGCKEYEKIRVKKAHSIVNTSWALGKMAHFENSAGIWLRNSLVKNIPLSVNRKQLEMIFTLP
ncbi:FAD-dependent monooxygenase [Flavobacterium humi]|uniref:Monooxygenase n=1 Tax=Flavobacterium humi TaxID=2562683 RepID=A0A4Z0LCA7_9FLAO|nr:FAD-dependent monooxygenase [Flavobacterium humi]TGD59507.1 monooxygenase [Flavobacterium humi]